MQTQTADYFTGIRDGLTSLALDLARSKLIDVEHVNDTRNLPDYIDSREDRGMSMAAMLMVGAAVVLGVVLLKRVL